MVSATSFTQPFFVLFAETFGLGQHAEGFFLDSGQSGLFGAIAPLDARQASSQRTPDDATIAAHCSHILHLLAFFTAAERGEHAAPDWAGSWSKPVLDEPGWLALQDELRTSYADLVARLNARTSWPDDAIGAMMMLLAHCAYHVGEIRQRISWVVAHE